MCSKIRAQIHLRNIFCDVNCSTRLYVGFCVRVISGGLFCCLTVPVYRKKDRRSSCSRKKGGKNHQKPHQNKQTRRKKPKTSKLKGTSEWDRFFFLRPLQEDGDVAAGPGGRRASPLSPPVKRGSPATSRASGEGRCLVPF